MTSPKSHPKIGLRSRRRQRDIPAAEVLKLPDPEEMQRLPVVILASRKATDPRAVDALSVDLWSGRVVLPVPLYPPMLPLLILPDSSLLRVVPGSVQRISQITGEVDRERGGFTDNRTESRFGLRGTDLGASFEHKGRLVFLFGDTWPTGHNTPDRPIDGDSIAFSNDKNPDDGLTLDFLTASDSDYLTVNVPGLSLGGFEVPNGGFSDGRSMYAYFTTEARFPPGGATMNRCVLLKSQDGRAWKQIHTVSTYKFINVSPVVVDAAKTTGLPFKTGKAVLLWASGRLYRHSNPHLACVPLERTEDQSALRYWSGEGTWSANEADARPLFEHPQLGEVSVAWNEPFRRWIMLYNSGNPRGIVMRTSETPWGPWTEPDVLYNPQDGYGKYMHVSWKSDRVDSVHDPRRENDYGGEYAPYMIPKFSKKNGTIYFVMSTWNPYNVVLMRAKLEVRH
ncbi:DUF4185 domain-containing protein [bacterium]|nr:MAG: DUF4185 domain-containing protein [bacterium]